MHKLISLIVILSGLYGGYWFVGADRLENGLKGYLTTEHGPDDPVQISYSDLSVQGFPNRFDTRLDQISITDKVNDIRYSAPFFQIYALSYKPYHIIASLAHSQTLHINGERLTISSDEIKGSVVFDAPSLLERMLKPDRSSFVLRNLAVSSDQGWETGVQNATVAIRQTPATPLHYDLAISAQDISLPKSLRALIDPARQLDALFDSLHLDSTLGFSNPLNLLAQKQALPALETINISDLTFIWDDVRFQAQGNLSIDRNGFLAGTLNLTATNWQKIYQLAQDTGAVDPEYAPTIQNGLIALAKLSKGDDVIKAPLVFADGQISIGPFQIGPAPHFR